MKSAILCLILCIAAGAWGQTAPQMIYEFEGDSIGDRFGHDVSDAGDVNNDGYPDIIVGAPLDNPYGPSNPSTNGSASVFSGKDGSILYTFYGDHHGNWLGFAVSGAGDVNNDATPIFLSAPIVTVTTAKSIAAVLG